MDSLSWLVVGLLVVAFAALWMERRALKQQIAVMREECDAKIRQMREQVDFLLDKLRQDGVRINELERRLTGGHGGSGAVGGGGQWVDGWMDPALLHRCQFRSRGWSG